MLDLPRDPLLDFWVRCKAGLIIMYLYVKVTAIESWPAKTEKKRSILLPKISDSASP